MAIDKETITKKHRSMQKSYFTIFSLIKQGFNPTQICTKLNIPQSTLSYYIKRLKASKSIKKKGYGTWEVIKFNEKQLRKTTVGRSPKFIKHCHQKKSKIRGHGFVFTIELPKIPNWKNREQFLLKKQINYKIINKQRVQRIIFREHKVWLCDKKLVIYTPKGKSYFSYNAESSENLALYEVKQLAIGLQNLFGISLQIGRNFKVSISRKHFGRINDSLAKQCDKQGKKLKVKLREGWFLIDNSYNLHEAETQGKKSKEYMDKNYVPFIESLMEMPFVTGDFHKLAHLTSKIAANQNHHEENIRSHIKAIQDMAKALKKIEKKIK